jgi:hypothetical protein
MIKGYKGFDKDLKCRNIQYEINKEYQQEGEIKTCQNGLHFCENPFDVFSHYPPSDSRYCQVEGNGDISKDRDDTKIACSKLKIGAEIGLKGMIEAGLNFIFEKVCNDEKSATGYQAGAQATGDQAGAQATGNQAGAQATGYQAGAQATGNQAGAQATGDRAGAQATGYQAGAQATGDMAMASANGSESSVVINGKHAVGCALGYKSKAKGTLGSWLVLAERGEWDGECYPIKNVKSKQVDGVILKDNIFYILQDGEFIEIT